MGACQGFRSTMVSAPAARRQRTMRLRARPDMPAAVSRIQPLPASTSDELHTDWACNLRHRTGWHGLKTRKHGILVVFTIVMDRRTHYIALDNLSSPTSPPRCIVDTAVCIDDLLYELSHFEKSLADDEVLETWEFTIKGPAAGSDGVCITVDRCYPIKEPVPVPRKAAEAEAGEDQHEDDLVVVGSDAESDGGCKVVCSGGESESDDEDDAGSEASSDANVTDL